MGLNVLFVGNRGGSLHSAQLVFDEDRTLANLDCGDTFDKAANFLLEHRGALFFTRNTLRTSLTQRRCPG